MFKARNIVVGLISSVALMTGFSAYAGSAPFMTLGQGVGAPAGFADLCRRDVATCGLPATQLALMGINAADNVAPTSSIGLATQHRVTFTPVASNDSERPLIAVETLEAFTPPPVEDFVAAGEERLGSKTTVQPTSLAWLERDERDQMKLLNRINQAVNRDVRKASDQEIYGQEEYWSLPRLVDGKLYGDCEDFALEKRRQLVAAGVPESALSLAVAITARGEGHAVLMVSLKSGDWVLDNLTPWATPWADLNYHWVERQIPGTALWTTIV